MNDITPLQVAEFLKENSTFTLYCHAGPDGDTLGSAVALCLALQNLGKVCHIFVCDAKIPEKLAFLNINGVIDGVTEGLNVSIDIASQPMLGDFAESVKLPFDLSIDHHSVNTVPCRMRLLEKHTACGELIYDVIKCLGVDLTKDIATALYAAISTDSGCFKYEGTTPETHLIASELLATGIDFAAMNRRLFEQKTLTQIRLEKEAYAHLDLYLGGRLAVVEFPEDVLSAVPADESDMDNIKQIPRQIYGAEVSAFVRHYPGVTKVSLRSNEYFDVADFASKYFGGGGHKHAAAFRMPATDENIGGLLADKLKELLR